MVGAFLILTLGVGIYFSRKKITFREYAVGSKSFATPTLVATVLATDYGGGMLLRNVEQVHSRGLYWIMLVLSTSFLSYWIISCLAVRMGPFMQNFSMAETIGRVYGRYPRAVAAASFICAAIPGLALQITAMSKAMAICAGSVDPKKLTILSTLILIFYSIYGGIRAVTFTDVLQFITFAIVIPVLCWFMFVNTNKQVWEIIPYLQNQEKFQFHGLCQFDTKLLANIFLFLSVLISYVEPAKMQRIYMSSGPVQAKTVFLYGGIFSCCIMGFIVLVGLFVFVASPSLPSTEIWGYILGNIPPLFQGFISISLLAMAMSSADSDLNACSIMVSHDILESLQKVKPVSHTYTLHLARLTTLFVGLSGMFLTFYFNDLLELLKLGFCFSIPILTAPFILATFGFRGTSRTALIGMTAGVLTILAWNKWVPGIDGSFVAMLANGLAMLAAHYLLKQPESAGWVGPDTHFIQIQQAKARRSAERKEAIKNGWANRRATLAKFKPSHTTIVCIGFYLAITSLVTHFIAPISHNGPWLIVQLMVAAFFIGYPFIDDISKKISGIFTELGWLIGLVVYFPFNLFWNWYHSVDPTFTLSLSLTHFALILLTLPLYLAIAIIAVSLLLTIYPICLGFSYALFCSLLPLLIVGLFLFAIITYLKVRQSGYISQLLYLKDQEQIRSSQQLKASLYDAALVPANRVSVVKGYGFILEQVVRKVEESISFLDKDTPLFKEDFQSIINKFYDWVTYFNRREKVKEHALLQPTQITIDKLMRKVEVALSQEIGNPPRLLVEKMDSPNGEMFSYIICDIHQV
ncbi:sodium:solute symporter, partial [Candidatus Cardinium sp. cBcalN2]